MRGGDTRPLCQNNVNSIGRYMCLWFIKIERRMENEKGNISCSGAGDVFVFVLLGDSLEKV